mgnify:CR=1 FL=1
MKYLLFFIPMVLIFFSCEEGNVTPEKTWKWTTYTSGDGLAGNEVHVVMVAGNNVKWFGTEYGASSFNGASWNSYNQSDGLIYQKVIAIAEDQNGIIWFGTPFGVSRFDGSNWVSYTTDNGLPDNYVYDIAVDENNVKWFATPSGAASYDGQNWNYYLKHSDTSIVHNHVRVVEVDNQNNKWFGTEFGVSKYDNAFWSAYISDHGNSWNFITDIDVNPMNNEVWISTLAGIIQYKNNNYSDIPYGEGLAYNQVYGVAFQEDNAWVATQRGVSKYDGSWETYTISDGLGANWVSDVEVDQNGIIWFATIAGGVTSLDTTD